MNKLDVHIISHSCQDRSATLEPLLRQLEAEPVNVHLVPGTKKLIGLGRAEGFSRGAAPLVSYVDDDDVIVPGIFSKIIQAFDEEERLDGVCTREGTNHNTDRMIYARQFRHKYYDKKDFLKIHHITAYRRRSILPHLDFISDCPTSSEHTLVARLMLKDAIIKHLPVLGYTWNQHSGSITSLGMVEHPKSQVIYTEVFNAARREMMKSHIPGQGFITQEDLDKWAL